MANAFDKLQRDLPRNAINTENDLEMVWLKFKSSSHDTVYLSSFYRPPDGDAKLTDKLREPLGAILDRHKNKPPIIIIAGDFNYPNINWKNVW